jgi:hypothetical protein
MEYEIEDRPQMGEDCGYEYVVTRHEFARGTLPPRIPVPDHDDWAMLIPEQEAGS